MSLTNALDGDSVIRVDADTLTVTAQIYHDIHVGPFALTKTGNGTLTLSGPVVIETLNAAGGITNLNNALGTGASVLNAIATVNLSASQTLAALNVADGVEVTFGNAPFFAGEPEKIGAPALVPEPGSLGLLLAGTLGLLGRRKRLTGAVSRHAA